MHSLKGATSREANRMLGISGQFWQHESFDHVIRDAAEFNRILQYVVYNPVTAGLVKTAEEWKWAYCKTNFNQIAQPSAWH